MNKKVGYLVFMPAVSAIVNVFLEKGYQRQDE
jgi:hypothetical protein